MSDVPGVLGSMPLFLGTETGSWALADFQVAARKAAALGVSSFLVKVADGTNLWYAHLGGWVKVIEAITQAGMSAIPYTYCYGDKYGALQGEINLLSAIMKQVGIVIADMEVEYNGQAGWAGEVTRQLTGIPGIFGITTWADPQLQNWLSVLSAFTPRVNFWLPQVYSNYLASVYHAQFDPYGIPYYPILNLGTDAGPNDLLQIAQSAKSPIIAFWEYQAAIGEYADTVKTIQGTLQEEQSTVLMINQVSSYFTEIQKDTRWHCPKTGHDTAYGILLYYRTCTNVGLNGFSQYGLPLSDEQPVPGCKNATYQQYERGVIVWDPSYEADKVPGLTGPCYPGHIDRFFQK